MARQLQEILQNSAKACGRISRGRRSRGCPWWNQECKDAHDDLRITRRICENQRGDEVQRSRVRFCRVLRRTRQKFWRNTINEVTTAEGVYKLTRWMKPRQRLQPPPIQVGDTTYSTDVQKAMALRKEKLERRDASDDIADGWKPAVSPPRRFHLQESSRSMRSRRPSYIPETQRPAQTELRPRCCKQPGHTLPDQSQHCTTPAYSSAIIPAYSRLRRLS